MRASRRFSCPSFFHPSTNRRMYKLLSNGLELLGSSPIFLSFVASCVSFQLRLLPSTGITRLRRYYKPLRHPSRPGLSLTSCRLIRNAITAGTSRVAYGPLCLHAVANTKTDGNLFAHTIPINYGLPRNRGGSA